MAFRKKGFQAKQSRRMSRQMSDSTLGTHVQRGSHSRRVDNASSVAFSNTRSSARASGSQVHTMAPSTTSAEGGAAYRRRVNQREYIEGVRRRVRIRRVLTAIVIVLALVAVAAAAGFIAFRGTVGSEMALKNSNAADALVPAKADEPYYMLITAELGAVAEPLEGKGPDVILLARLDKQAGSLALVNIPASLQVANDNGNASLSELAYSGDAALLSAVSSFAKVDISHYVKIDKGGIAGMADALDGIKVNVDQVIDDPHAGDVYIPAGDYPLKGEGALTYLRATNLKLGVEDQLNHQLDFAAALVSQLFSSDGSFATRLDSIDAYFQTDMSLADVESIAGWLSGVSMDSIRREALPGYMKTSVGVVESGQSYYVGTAADMAKIIESLEGGAQTDSSASASASASAASVAAPSSFTVEVQNGTDIEGAAGVIADMLTSQGFKVAKKGNAEQQVYNETLVVYNVGKLQAKAEQPADEADALAENGEEAEAGEEGAPGDGTEMIADAEVPLAEEPAAQDVPTAASATRETTAEEGLARANAVIQAIGMGRAVEAGSYYNLTTDVLVIVGYDYKPVN